MKRLLLFTLLGTLGAFAQTQAPNPSAPAGAQPVPLAAGRGGGGGGRGALPQRTEVESSGPTPAQALLVGEKDVGSLAIIDPVKLEIIARIPVGNQPHEVVSDGKFAYVSNSGATTMTVVDVAGQKRLPSVDMNPMGALHGITVAGGKLYISHENSRIISRYNPETARIDWSLGTGFGSHLIIVAPDERTMYLASVGDEIMATIEGTTPFGAAGGRGGGGGRGAPGGGAGPGAGGQAASAASVTNVTPAAPAAPGAGRAGGGRGGATITRYPSGVGVEGFDISPDRKEFWAVNVRDKSITVVDLAQKRVVDTIALPTTYSNRLRFTLDGKYVLVSELQGNQMLVLDAKTRKEVKRIDVGAGGEGIFIEPSGARAFYAVSRGGKVAVIDTKTLEVIKEITGLQNPDGMDWHDSRPKP
jgi:YVTN family beta-propeller protein